MLTTENHTQPYRQIFSMNRAIMLLINPDDGGIIDASLGACQYYGYSLPELMAMTIFDINTMSKAEIKAEIQLAREMHKNHFDFQHRLASGEIRDVEVISNPVVIENRTFLYSVIQDATVRKQAEKALHENEEKYRLLVESTPAIVYSFSDRSGGLYYSPHVLNVLGYSSEYLCNHPMLWHDSIHTDDLSIVDAAITGLEEGIRFDLEYRIRNADGDWLWFHDRNTVIQKKEGEVIIYGVAIDITDKKQMELALWESEEKYRALVNDIPDILYRTDNQGRITYITPSAYRMSGYTQQEAIGMKMAEEVYAEPDERKKLLEALQQTGYVENFEARLKRKDGSIWWGAANVHLLKAMDGTPVGVEGVVRDISDRKRVEAELLQHRLHLEELVDKRTQELALAKEAAEAATRAKSEFLANMSHEIRTPLNAILGLAKIGMRESREDKSQQSFSHIISSGQHLLGVINDILDFSKIEEGKVTIESQPLQLVASVENIAGLMLERAWSRDLVLKVGFDSDLPVWVQGDLLRLRQILLNLLSNAIKFTRQGEVSLFVKRDAEMTQFRVGDSGVGMSDEQISRLFNPFEQADSSTTRKFGGTGLGLTISHNLAKLMGGWIEVESQVGIGSVFTLNLPLSVTHAPVVSDVVTSGKSGMQLAGLRILAAEDVEMNRIILADLLEHEGAQVVLVEHGVQALDQLKEENVNSFDLVLMDVQMPVMDGYEATRQIQLMAPELAVIGLTAHALAEEREKCLAAGMVEHITKPIDPDVLVAAIRRNVEMP